jgi:hypothetical protein
MFAHSLSRAFPLVALAALTAAACSGQPSDEAASTLVAHLDPAACASATDWAPNTAYATGAIVRYMGVVYEVIQGHTSLANWTPDVVPALFRPTDCAGGGASNPAPAPTSPTPPTTPPSGGANPPPSSPPSSPPTTPPTTPPSTPPSPPVIGGGGGSFRSPVFFMPLDNQPQDITEAIAQTGEKNYLLAFVLDSGGCTPAWDGQSAHAVSSDTQVAAVVNAARAAGGDVGVSFGGYNGMELGQSCGSASALAAAYQSVIDKYKLTHIDLDVENAALGDVANETKRFQAVKMLEDAAAAAGRKLVVSLTIPTTTIGLPDTGKDEIRAAISAGCRIDIINVMDFDYGAPAASQVDSGIGVAEAVHAQLKSLYGWSDADAYAHTGLQLMNGHTDQPSELFTQATFLGFLTYAQQHHLGWLSYWSLNRDRPCDASVPHNWAEGYCSSVDQKPYEFTKIVAGYGG